MSLGGLAVWPTSLSGAGASGSSLRNLEVSLLEIFSGMLDFSRKDLRIPGCLRAGWLKGAGCLHIHICMIFRIFLNSHFHGLCTIPVF